MNTRKFRLLSFSGIDGAGKSTQIDAVLRHLQDHGRRVQLYTFWDDVVAFSQYREHASLRLFKGEKGVGSPERPIARRDKNVSSWYVVVLRLFLYFLDCVRLWVVVHRCAGKNVDCVVFDRYIYDELANLPLQHWPVRLYARSLLRITPKPDLAFLLDADPAAAFLRKPEYPLEFVRHNRQAYLTIANLTGMLILPPSSIAETNQAIRGVLAGLREDAGSSVLPDPTPFSASGAKPLGS